MNQLETAQAAYDAASSDYRTEWARGDSPALAAAEARRDAAWLALCEENRRSNLIDAVRAHALRCYEQGWDVVVECYDDADLLDMIGAATTADAAIKSVAATLGLDAKPLTGFIVTNSDVDGTSRRAYQSYRFAAERFQDMSGRELPACVEDWLRSGIRSSHSAVGDFGNRVTIQFFA